MLLQDDTCRSYGPGVTLVLGFYRRVGPNGPPDEGRDSLIIARACKGMMDPLELACPMVDFCRNEAVVGLVDHYCRVVAGFN